MVDKNRIEGTAREAVGKVEDAAGELLGDTETQVAGKIRQAAGILQSAYGKAADEVQDATGSIIRIWEEQPVMALLVTLAIGFFLGRLSVTAQR
jgi:uncharacterized protein YjbJ (UPF0337 family)